MNPTLKKTLVALSVLAIAGGGLFSYRRHLEQSPEQRYRTQTVEKGDLVQTVSANGTLNPGVLVNVGTQVSGTVTKLYVDFNDKVVKDQPLLELDQALLSAQARQSAANVVNAGAEFDLAHANEARVKALFAQEYVSRQDLDQAVQARKSAAAQLTQAKAAADKNRVNLGNTVIRSPVSGIVVNRVVDIGQTVAASLKRRRCSRSRRIFPKCASTRVSPKPISARSRKGRKSVSRSMPFPTGRSPAKCSKSASIRRSRRTS